MDKKRLLKILLYIFVIIFIISTLLVLTNTFNVWLVVILSFVGSLVLLIVIK